MSSRNGLRKSWQAWYFTPAACLAKQAKAAPQSISLAVISSPWLLQLRPKDFRNFGLQPMIVPWVIFPMFPTELPQGPTLPLFLQAISPIYPRSRKHRCPQFLLRQIRSLRSVLISRNGLLRPQDPPLCCQTPISGNIAKLLLSRAFPIRLFRRFSPHRNPVPIIRTTTYRPFPSLTNAWNLTKLLYS
jgi:hypothetical protein